MTKVLSRKIDSLSPDQQAELLRYVDSLLTKSSSKPRMTLDNRQEQSISLKQLVEEQLSLVGYKIW